MKDFTHRANIWKLSSLLTFSTVLICFQGINSTYDRTRTAANGDTTTRQMVPACFAFRILINYRSTSCVGPLARSRLSARTLITRHTHTTERRGWFTTRTQRGRRLVAVDNRYHRRPGIRISSTVSRISSWYRFPAPPTKSGRQKESRRQTHLEPHLAARANGSA